MNENRQMAIALILILLPAVFFGIKLLIDIIRDKD